MAEPARSLPCEYFFPDGGIPTGERIDKLLLSQVLENEEQCPENGSFLDTSILV
ncbi:hypothetical protein SAMN04488048_1472 [Trichococcus flocculiformis]|nr:Hypothetical protein TES5_2920 [Trichococcus sp. ES5]SHG24048.1 hypothetical protein SAMN04488048_1472 [Trichococcus flocculiformis]